MLPFSSFAENSNDVRIAQFAAMQFPVTSIREMKILKYLRHPNIVELKEIVSSSGALILVV